MAKNNIIPIDAINMNKCFDFWDFADDKLKQERLLKEIETGKRKMFAYVKNDEYIAGFSISFLNEKQLKLAYLVVKEVFRNQGIGGFIIEYAFEYCKEHNKQELLLKVDVDNVNAKRLYERKGFIPIGAADSQITLRKTLNK